MITKTITERIEEEAEYYSDTFGIGQSIAERCFIKGAKFAMNLLLEELKSEKDKEYNQSGNSELWYGMNKCISILENR